MNRCIAGFCQCNCHRFRQWGAKGCASCEGYALLHCRAHGTNYLRGTVCVGCIDTEVIEYDLDDLLMSVRVEFRQRAAEVE